MAGLQKRKKMSITANSLAGAQIYHQSWCGLRNKRLRRRPVLSIIYCINSLKGMSPYPKASTSAPFVLHDGQPPIVVVERVAEKRQNVSLKVLRDTYLNAVRHSLETNTVKLLELHFRHLVTTYSERWETSQLSVAELQRHIDRRAGAKGRNGQTAWPQHDPQGISHAPHCDQLGEGIRIDNR